MSLEIFLALNRNMSLKDLCLNFIAATFERFHFAFAASNDENIKRDFEFLMRYYSSELASELFIRGELKDEYLDFVINKHLKFLDEEWLMHSRYRNSMKDIFCRLPNLTNISCSTCNDEILESIAEFCPKIVEIDASSSSITDNGVKYLCKNGNGDVPCPDLKKISIDTIGVTMCGVKYLIENLKSLETLDHKEVPLALYSLHKENLPELKNVPLYNLFELNLYGTDALLPYYKDLLKICLTVCPKLKSLSCFISDREQLDLLNNTCLYELSIDFTNRKSDREISVDSVLKKCGSNLDSLSVFYCTMTVSELSVSCPKLKKLVLVGVTFQNDHGDLKSIFSCLVCCIFFYIKISKANDKAMSLLLLSSPNLEDVKFCFSDLSPDMKTIILKCCEKCPLTTIFFHNTNVESNFLRHVHSICKSLTKLNIEN